MPRSLQSKHIFYKKPKQTPYSYPSRPSTTTAGKLFHNWENFQGTRHDSFPFFLFCFFSYSTRDWWWAKNTVSLKLASPNSSGFVLSLSRVPQICHCLSHHSLICNWRLVWTPHVLVKGNINTQKSRDWGEQISPVTTLTCLSLACRDTVGCYFFTKRC